MEYLSFDDFSKIYQNNPAILDEVINIQDVILIVNFILTSDYNSLADLNNDNEVDVLDVVYILNLILNRGT